MNATKVTVSTFGILAGLAGIEHGVGEVLQGNVAPDGLAILSWPDSDLFRILAGEPAMTIVPSLLLSGVLAILTSLIFLVWATLFVQHKRSGLVLMMLSIVMLLVGAGFGPPLLGILVAVAATRIHAPLPGWHSRFSTGSRHLLAALWPGSFISCLIAWLALLPGAVLVDHLFGVANPDLVISVLVFSAFGLLLLTIFTGFVYDAQRQPDTHRTPTTSGS